jgi:hypothetical protein
MESDVSRGEQHRREYNGFDIAPNATALPEGGYGASVTLTLNVAEVAMATSFDLPPDPLLTTRDEALQQAVRYGFGLVDGFILSLHRETLTSRAQAG